MTKPAELLGTHRKRRIARRVRRRCGARVSVEWLVREGSVHNAHATIAVVGRTNIATVSGLA
jgi:hypothetical protein